ncbi:unnamed protein product [Mucor hiemalis]
MTTINDQQQQQQQQQQQNENVLPQFTFEEYEAEKSYFQEYDQEMIEAVTEAECYDYYEQQEEVEEEEEMQQEEEYILDHSLLKLIVDVQSYLAEAPQDSPLFALQYKMYTYLKQRATEMGMEIPNTII